MRTLTGVVGAAMALLGGQASMAELQWTNTPVGASSIPAAVGSRSTFGGARLPLYDEQRWSPSGALRVTPILGNVGMAASVDIAIVNPGADIERSACVSVAIRPGVAYECGDLRIAYNLPAIRVFNQSRAPALTYNSQHARPTPIVRANVTASAFFGLRPASVQAFLSVNGVGRAANSWSGGNWTAQGQLALSFDASDLPTNLYPYTLSVYFFYPGGQVDFRSATGELAIVNRTTSEFGRGWWVSGYEQIIALPGGNAFWVGGDGSTRKYVYNYDLNGRSVFKARTLSGVDSVTKDANGNWYRHLPRGAFVRFNSAGRHEVTVSDLGRVTQFASWSCSRLNGIYLPVPPGQANLFWSFNYDVDGTANACTSQAKYTGSAASNVANPTFYYRWTSRYIQPSSGSFSYDNAGAVVAYTEANGRINSIQDVRGTTTRFGYDVGGLLDTASSPTGVGADSIRQYFRAGEGAALATADAQSNMYTALYSPRPEITTPTKLYLGPWGNPLTIIDPLGRTTSILPDPTFPLLADRVTGPSGYSTYALYTTDGKMRYQISDAVNGQTPEWYYRYLDPNFPDNLTNTTDPAGVTTNFTYTSLNGALYPLLATQQLGTDPATKVSFAYCTATNCFGQPSADTSAQNAQGQRSTDTYEYDANGNLSATQTAGGKRTEYVNDDIGQVTITQTRLAVTPYVRWLIDSTWYDLLSRVTRTTRSAWGDGTQGSGPQSFAVTTAYLGATGLPTSVTRSASDGIMGTLRDSTEYDALGRVTRRFAQGVTLPESLTYDPAGNVTRRVTARGGRMTSTYDALNRPDSVITSAMAYPSMRIGTATYTSFDPSLTPAFPRVALGRSGDPLVVDGDTARFTYDVGTGQVATANNRAAQVSRTYHPNGALLSETQNVRTVTGDDFAQHSYTIQYAYDVAGRRTTVTHPTQLAPGSKTETWAYDPGTGRPTSVRDPMDSTVKFFFDPAGQLIRQITPNNVSRQYIYTLDGEVLRDLLAPGNSTVGPPLTPVATPLDPLPRNYQYVGQYEGYVRYVDYTYDARGKLMSANNAMGLRDSMTFDYTPMGHLRHSTYATRFYDYLGTLSSTDSLRTSETIRPDAMGTSTWRQTATQSFSVAGAVYSQGRYNASAERIPTYLPNTGRLARTTLCSPTTCVTVAKDTLWYDASGNTYVQQHRDFSTQGTGVTQGEATERVMYFNAADQLVAVDARIGSAPGWENYLHFLLTFDTYRYDALGRRVFTQSQRQCPSYNLGVYQGADFFVECNLGYVQRTVWDGSKELYEVRMPDQSQHWEKDGFAVGDTLGVVNNNATDKIIDRDAFYGRVGYVYGGAIDKPLVMLRQDYGDRNFRLNQNPKPYRRFEPFALYPQWDLRGEPSLGTSADGGISRCEMDGSVKRCTYAMAWTQVWAPNGKQIDPLVRGWAGSLLQDKREPNGLLYRRNRYLDPATGRFTQPDPIGIAGGLNAYGYANGDPVSFRDPFGLAPDTLVAGDPNGPRPDLEKAIVAALDSAQAGLGGQVQSSPSVFGIFFESSRKGDRTWYNPESIGRLAERLGRRSAGLSAGSYIGSNFPGCAGSSVDSPLRWVGAHAITHQLGYVAGISLETQRDASSHYQRAVTEAITRRGMERPHSPDCP